MPYISVQIGETIYNKITWEGDNVMANGLGRVFGRWIDYADASGTTRGTANGTANDPGYDAGVSTIQQPAYIIESIIRDEILAERDLVIDSSASSTTFVDADVMSDQDDYYNNAEMVDVTGEVKRYITDYDGSTHTFTVDSSLDPPTGHNYYLTNIQGDNLIDIESFDRVGNSTNGKRDGWMFARSIYNEISSIELLNSILFESWCILFRSNKKYKLVALESGTSLATWSSSLYESGFNKLKSVTRTPLSNVYSSFRLRYSYSYAKNDYTKEFYVDRNGYSPRANYIGSTEQQYCEDAYMDYHTNRVFEYNADWIYDDDTAEYCLKKIVEWFRKQRLLVTWYGDVGNYIKYEIGDQVKLNDSDIIPTGVNNSSNFMIYEKTIVTAEGTPHIIFKLIELG